MKVSLTTILCLFLFIANAQETKKVFGKVSDGNAPMAGVNVFLADKEVSTTTDAEGNYEIQALVGDKLQFSFTGMKTISIKIEDVTRILNPIMIPDVTELDEVVVAASKRRSQKDLEEDYAINKKIIRTAWGLVDGNRAAGSIKTMDEEEITMVYSDLPTLLASRFPTVSIGPNGWISLRGGWPAVLDIDGQIFAPSLLSNGEFTPAPQLNLGNIRRIAIMPSLASSASYGTIGRGGVVVINTLVGNPKKEVLLDRARLKNNFIKGDVLSKSELEQNMPTYMKELLASTSSEAAKSVFDKYDNKYSSSPYFYIDAYTYFYEERNDKAFADEIIDSNFKTYRNNAVLMKALAYTYEQQGRYKKANEAYKEVFILRPHYAQSYLDMANSYRNLKEPKQAASMYARYEYLLEEGFMQVDTAGFGPIIYREYNNLLMLEKEALVRGRKAKNLFVADESFQGTRLVFEWNDSEAEFDLQFVNPGNQYHTWKHSLADNSDIIEREKEFGYNTTEYLIDGSLPGTWKVNVNYLGNKSLTPTYLKATVYYDYGSRNQREEVKVFKLSLKNANYELFQLNSSSKLMIE